MLTGLMAVVLMLAGAACLGAGFLLGSWRERSLLRAELGDMGDPGPHDEMMRLMKSLFDESFDSRNDRPN